MPSAPEYVFFVLIRTTLIGGSVVSDVDVFPAESANEAENMARNSFTQTPDGQGLMYGDTFFYPTTVAALEAKSLGGIDLDNPHNAKWKASMDLFDVMAREGQPDGQTEQDRYFENSSGDSSRGMHFGG